MSACISCINDTEGTIVNTKEICCRLNTNNLVEPVAQGLDLQLQEPFLLYRNSRCNIYGIWFYEKEECVRIANTINKLLKESKESRKVNSKPLAVKEKKTSGPNVNNVDIFSMLSKAQEDFNTSRNSGSGGGGGGDGDTVSGSKSPLVTPTDNMPMPLSAPLGPDVTSQSVMDFFAKAKVNVVSSCSYVRIRRRAGKISSSSVNVSCFCLGTR